MDRIIVKKLKPARRPRWLRLLRWIFLGGLVGALAVASFLAPIWRQTPRGTSPVVRVRTLDLIQAASLRRTALAEAARGRSMESLMAWRMAMANRPGYRPLMREALESMTAGSEIPEEGLPYILGITGLLLDPSSRGSSDLDVAVRVLGRCGMYDEVVSIALPELESLTPAAASMLAQACMNLGLLEEFDRVRSRHGAGLHADAAMQLCTHAWLACSGRGAEGVSALRTILTVAGQAGPMRPLARRLALVVGAGIGDVLVHERIFSEMDAAGELQPLDHVRRWRLHHSTGDVAEARRLAEAYALEPVLASDAMRIAEAMLAIGMKAQCVSFLRRQIERFPVDPNLWGLCIEHALETATADDLRWMMVNIRNQPALVRHMAPHALLLEAIWSHRTGREASAREAGRALVRLDSFTPEFARWAARELVRCGLHGEALALFIRAEERFAPEMRYWLERLEAAQQARDGDQLLATAQAAHRRDPSNLVCAHNLAAVLLMLRQRPDEAVALSFDVMTQAAHLPNAELNHAVALLRVGRVEEGGRLLRKAIPARRDRWDEAWYRMAWLELYVQAGDCDAVRRTFSEIRVGDLWPQQVDWVRSWLEGCEAR